MYSVQMQKECTCFKKSEYCNNMTFERQKDAYQYANIVAEFMNEEFCSKHTFSTQRVEGGNMLISVAINVDAIPGYNPHISCDVGCNSTDNWSLESTEKVKDDNS
ncbi:MAG: hypothetical protein K0U47_08630 [Epsilonproteobacteria bacterium]|nr:hypothetical protein [Campylobacterota bacterium]